MEYSKTNRELSTAFAKSGAKVIATNSNGCENVRTIQEPARFGNYLVQDGISTNHLPDQDKINRIPGKDNVGFTKDTGRSF